MASQFIIVPFMRKASVNSPHTSSKGLAECKKIEIFQGVFAYIPVGLSETVYPSSPVTFSRYIGERGKWSMSTYDHLTIEAPWIFVVPDEGTTFTLPMLNSIITFNSRKTMQERLDLRTTLPTKDPPSTFSFRLQELIWWSVIIYLVYVATTYLFAFAYRHV